MLNVTRNRTTILGLIMTLLATGCASKLESAQTSEVDPEKSVIMDDMILDLDEMSAGGVQQGAKGFTAYQSTPWTNGVIPVKFDSTINTTRKNKFLAQCARWTKVANVKCVTYTNQAKFLLVTAKDTTQCYAHVGMGKTAGTRVFNFGINWCWDYDWSILHDIGHVMGLIHEHQRSDRDKYIEVLTSNILPGYAFAFDKLGTSQNVTAYDFQSIMQYPSYSYAVSGKQSMRARPAYASSQKYLNVQPTVLSAKDITTIRNIYGAPKNP